VRKLRSKYGIEEMRTVSSASPGIAPAEKQLSLF
jgi:hypothetical protein